MLAGKSDDRPEKRASFATERGDCIFGFADGGKVSGPGSGTSDSIPAMLSHGEFVVNAGATKKHAALRAAINEGKVPHFAIGGAVEGFFNNSPSWSQTINVTAHGSDRDLANSIGCKVQATSGPPDTFRKSDAQRLAEAHRASSLAGRRLG